jgi:queuosine biosynthesis protein QueC
VLDLSLLGRISDTALTQDKAIELTRNGLPNTFVPGRNLLFLNFAAAVAYRRGLSVLVGGMCETDYSGYPDCRDNTLKALQVALSLGLDTRMVVETPLMWLDKAATWRLAHTLGGEALVDLIREHTHTCYLGDAAAATPGAMAAASARPASCDERAGWAMARPWGRPLSLQGRVADLPAAVHHHDTGRLQAGQRGVDGVGRRIRAQQGLQHPAQASEPRGPLGPQLEQVLLDLLQR